MDELTRLAAARPDRLGRLAQDWLASGARAVQLWSPDGLAATWDPAFSLGAPAGAVSGRVPRATTGRAAGITAEVAPLGGSIGWVRVVGASGAAARRRLAGDAAILATLVDHERELRGMADALAESQDHLLGLASIAVAGGRDADEAAILATTARQVRFVTGAPVVAAAVVGDGARLVVDADVTACGVESVLADIDAAPAAAATLPVSPGSASINRVGGWIVARVHLDRAASVVLLVGPDAADATSESIRLIEAAAEVAGSIISRSRRSTEAAVKARLAEELKVAGEVQRHLVATATVPVEGLDLAARYRPAAEIGGDVLAVHADGPRTVIAVGDVSGKGIPAALLMASARASFASAARACADPAAILARMTQDLGGDLERTCRFLTLCVAVVDRRDNSLVIANAGHAPVLLASGMGRPQLLRAENAPLGVAEGPFASTRLSFAAGDRLVIASDGISEREDAAERRFGIARIVGLVHRRPTASAGDMADAILNAVDRFAGPAVDRRDDETLVVVGWR